MRQKLLNISFAVITSTMLVTVVIVGIIFQNQYVNQITNKTTTELMLLRSSFSVLENYDDRHVIDLVSKQYAFSSDHVSIIDGKGRLIYDSDGLTSIEDKRYYKAAFEAYKQDEILVMRDNHIRTFSSTLTILAPVQVEGFKGMIKVVVVTNLLSSVMKFLLCYIAIACVIGYMIARSIANNYRDRIVKPINSMTEAAIEIQNGNYSERIYSTQKNELGLLSNAFNEMTFKMKNFTTDLGNRNSELESVLKSMNHGIVVIDNDMRVAIKNRRFIELFHIDEPNIEGELFFKVTRNLAVFDVFEKAKEKKRVVHLETKYERGEDVLTYLLSANPIKSVTDNDVIIGTLLVVQDVTEVRKLETIRTDFVSNVTHELKTPLTSIKGFVETLSSGAIEDQKVAVRFLDIIHIEAERLELLINDILTLSEIEALGSDSNRGSESVQNILSETIEILAPKAEEKGISLMAEIEEDISPYKCNRNRIKQVFINLISNAIKYTEVGHVKLVLRETRKTLIFIIEDTGIGIDEEHIPRLFERFYRVDKGRSRKQGGTGLGLSIVKHIVELYNGRINVESQLGKGTKMTIYLPYKE